jgi:sugar lactone lactonase YvrE
MERSFAFYPVVPGYRVISLKVGAALLSSALFCAPLPVSGQVSVQLSADGVGAENGVLQFGTIPFSTTELLPLTITNVGVAGTVTLGTVINGPSYKILTTGQNTCQAGIPAGQSCTLPVEFDPVGVGQHNDYLTLTPSGGAAASQVALRGVASGVGTKQEGPLAFTTIPVGTLEIVLLPISNVGISDTVTLGTSINGPSYKILNSALNTCGQGIMAGQSCVLPIEFSPVGAGRHDDILTLTPSEGAASTVRLLGTSTPAVGPTAPVKGNIYVFDAGNQRVEIFDATGAYVGQFDHGFDEPTGIAVNATNVYVKDGNNHCQIDKFDGNGNFILQFGLCNGEGPGYLDGNGSLALDASGNIWATDGGAGYLEKFDGNGNFLAIVCTVAITAKNILHCPLVTPFDSSPQTIALDASNNIYVTNLNFPEVSKFDSTGKYLFSFGMAGSGNGEFVAGFQDGIAVNSAGDIYVVDSGNNRVQVFDAKGTYLSQFGSYGMGNGQFRYPSALALDAEGNVFVTDVQNSRVEKFDHNGTYLSQFGSPGKGNGQMNAPLGVAIVP